MPRRERSREQWIGIIAERRRDEIREVYARDLRRDLCASGMRSEPAHVVAAMAAQRYRIQGFDKIDCWVSRELHAEQREQLLEQRPRVFWREVRACVYGGPEPSWLELLEPSER